jgi:glutamate synthase (NADPH) large chain
MASLGVRSMAELIGRTELLTIAEGETASSAGWTCRRSSRPPASRRQAAVLPDPRNPPFDKGELAEQMVRDMPRRSSARGSAAASVRREELRTARSARAVRRDRAAHGNYGMSDAPIR